MPLWGGDVAKKVSLLEQGGMVWVFKIPKGSQTAAADAPAKGAKTAKTGKPAMKVALAN